MIVLSRRLRSDAHAPPLPNLPRGACITDTIDERTRITAAVCSASHRSSTDQANAERSGIPARRESYVDDTPNDDVPPPRPSAVAGSRPYADGEGDLCEVRAGS
jgi:hypothetical protein